jgi:tRNA threonylcarbamoyladenosine biosynthesis protein TsaE
LKIIQLHSLDDLSDFSSSIVKTLKAGDVFLMDGDLGAGKTTFVRFVCDQLGVSSVSSPTFNIINKYDADLFTVFHMDLYRCETAESIDLLDLEEIFSRPNAIFFVEWAERLGDVIPEKYTKMSWSLGEGESRKIDLESFDES